VFLHPQFLAGSAPVSRIVEREFEYGSGDAVNAFVALFLLEFMVYLRIGSVEPLLHHQDSPLYQQDIILLQN
jgi:hypothetical protein